MTEHRCDDESAIHFHTYERAEDNRLVTEILLGGEVCAKISVSLADMEMGSRVDLIQSFTNELNHIFQDLEMEDEEPKGMLS